GTIAQIVTFFRLVRSSGLGGKTDTGGRTPCLSPRPGVPGRGGKERASRLHRPVGPVGTTVTKRPSLGRRFGRFGTTLGRERQLPAAAVVIDPHPLAVA